VSLGLRTVLRNGRGRASVRRSASGRRAVAASRYALLPVGSSFWRAASPSRPGRRRQRWSSASMQRWRGSGSGTLW